jgi:hypothetical protein
MRDAIKAGMEAGVEAAAICFANHHSPITIPAAISWLPRNEAFVQASPQWAMCLRVLCEFLQGIRFRLLGESVWIQYCVLAKIYIQIRPVIMAWGGFLDICDHAQRYLREPWEIFI